MEESIKKFALLAALFFVFISSSSAFARGGGGCLARGTPIITPTGTVAIESLRVGDRVWSMAGETLLPGKVQMLTEVHTEYYLKISAGGASLMITPEHPVMVGPGKYRIARHLSAGERIYMMRGGQSSCGIHYLNSSCSGTSAGLQSARCSGRHVHARRYGGA